MASVAAIWFLSLIGAVASFGILVVASNSMRSDEFGRFASDLAVASMLGPLAGLGVGSASIIAAGGDPQRFNLLLPTVLRYALITSALAVLLHSALSANRAASAHLLSLFVVSFSINEILSAWLQVAGRTGAMALWQATPHLARLFGVIAIVALAGSVSSGAASAIVGVLSAGVALVGLRIISRQVQREVPVELRLGEIARLALPVGVSALLYTGNLQVATVMVERAGLVADAGAMSIASMSVLGLQLLPLAAYQRYALARIYRASGAGVGVMLSWLRRGLVLSPSIGLLAMLLLWALAPLLLPSVLDGQSDAVMDILSILGLAVPVRFLASAVAAYLQSGRALVFKSLALGTGLLLQVTCGLAWVGIEGAFGVAKAVVLSDVVVVLMLSVGASIAWRRRGLSE